MRHFGFAGRGKSNNSESDQGDDLKPINERQDMLHVCGPCTTSDPFLHKLIDDDAEDGYRCMQCEKKRRTITIANLGELVHTIYKRYAIELEPEYQFDDGPMLVDSGSAPLDILQTEFDIEFDVAEPLLKYLFNSHGRKQRSDTGSDWYDNSNESFGLQVPDSEEPEHEWAIFEEQVKHHGRFFNKSALLYLNELFDPVLNGDLHGGAAPIATLGPNSKIRSVFRGRMATTEVEQRRIYNNPDRTLAAPPEAFRRANRMNAEGVSAFYGALDRKTCIAELRPFVHSKIIVGKFEILSQLRILDLRLIEKAQIPQVSWFDPELANKVAKVRFIQNLHETMRRPIIPGTETMEYLPTQFIAEYLASKGIDGVLYASSLITREAVTGKDNDSKKRSLERKGINLVLFAHAAASINDRDSRNSEVTYIEPFHSDQQFVTRLPPSLGASVPYPIVGDANEPTLRLRHRSITICEIRAIHYGVKSRRVAFITPEERENSAFQF